MLTRIHRPRVGVMQPVTAIPRRVQQAMLQLPANEFPHRVMVLGTWADMGDRGDLRFRECDHLHPHQMNVLLPERCTICRNRQRIDTGLRGAMQVDEILETDRPNLVLFIVEQFIEYAIAANAEQNDDILIAAALAMRLGIRGHSRSSSQRRVLPSASHPACTGDVLPARRTCCCAPCAGATRCARSRQT